MGPPRPPGLGVACPDVSSARGPSHHTVPAGQWGIPAWQRQHLGQGRRESEVPRQGWSQTGPGVPGQPSRGSLKPHMHTHTWAPAYVHTHKRTSISHVPNRPLGYYPTDAFLPVYLILENASIILLDVRSKNLVTTDSFLFFTPLPQPPPSYRFYPKNTARIHPLPPPSPKPPASFARNVVGASQPPLPTQQPARLPNL